jgi:RNA 2',3'-cyclic 3'-phosphodiesterase
MRAFFALWPDETERKALHAQAIEAAARTGGRAVAPEKLHLTLLFLGQIDERTAACLAAGAGRAAFEDFDLSLSAIGGRRKAGVAWIAPDEVPAPLARLHQSLAAMARDCGISLEPRAYVPHLTLARKIATAMPQARVAPVVLGCKGFCLVRSDTGSGRYEIIGRWP